MTNTQLNALAVTLGPPPTTAIGEQPYSVEATLARQIQYAAQVENETEGLATNNFSIRTAEDGSVTATVKVPGQVTILES